MDRMMKKAKGSEEEISILITAWKEEKTLQKALESIKGQMPEHAVVWVVAPDAPTLNVAKQWGAKAIRDPGKGKGNALNMAFAKVKGEILVMTDGDVVIAKESIPKLIEHFKDEKVGAVSARPISLNSRKTMLGYWSHFLIAMAHEVREKAVKKNKVVFVSGYLYAMRSGLVEKIPKNTLADDGLISALIAKKGYKVIYEPGATVEVKFPTTIADWILQKKRSTGGYLQIKEWTGFDLRSFGEEAKGILKPFFFARSVNEIGFSGVLIFLRLYLWLRIALDIRIRKEKFAASWKRVESTKS